jgi:hypothetical protein
MSLQCHILTVSGALKTIVIPKSSSIKASELIENHQIAPFISQKHRVFSAPGCLALENENLSAYQQVFILGPAHISPLQWRQQRLALIRTTKK